MSIELLSFGKNSPGEYAMLNGWDLDPNTWDLAQNRKYMKWASVETPPTSSYSNITDYAVTTYEPPAVEMQTFRPGQNSVITTTDPAGVSPTLDEDIDKLIAEIKDSGMYGGDPEVPEPEGYDEPVDQEVLDFVDEEFGVEMQPMGGSRVIEPVAVDPYTVGPVEPYTIGEIKPFNAAAEAWQMPNARSMQIVGDLEAPLLQNPKLDLSQLQQMVPAEELEAALSESLVGYNSFGFPELNVKALASGLGGAAGGVVTQLLLNELKKTGRAGEDVSNMIQVVGGGWGTFEWKWGRYDRRVRIHGCHGLHRTTSKNHK